MPGPAPSTAPPAPAPGLRRSRSERARAWLHVGPLGHLYGFLADFAEMMGRFLLARARERLREMRTRGGAPGRGA